MKNYVIKEKLPGGFRVFTIIGSISSILDL